MFVIKRVYDAASASDGARFLVERLWPRGMKKTELKMDAWLKDVAPSTELRRWFSHDPEKWPEFRRRYFAELKQHGEALQPLLAAAERHDKVTLLYSSHDQEHNNAAALREYLAKHRR